MSMMPSQPALAFRQGGRLGSHFNETRHANHIGPETDEPCSLQPGTLSRQPSQDSGDRQNATPVLSHRLRHDSSILCLVLGGATIYAGTQGGDILVYDLNTYTRTAIIEGHRGSVLALCLSPDGNQLFSSAGDRIVNVWSTVDLSRISSLHSRYDVGDIFCVAYSTLFHTVYLGAQNTTIQWCSSLTENHPSHRPQSSHGNSVHAFFDSPDPTGARTPKPNGVDFQPKHAHGGRVLDISRENVKHFAHYGYVYCMLLIRDSLPDSWGREVLVTGGGDGRVKLWRLRETLGGAPEELHTLDDGREEGHSVLSVAVDGTFLYAGRSGGDINVWDLETRQLVRNLKAHRDDVLAISVGGGFIFSAAVTGFVRKFDKQYNLKSRHKAHDGRILASAFSYHQRRPIYVTGGSDCTIAVWDINDCQDPAAAARKTSNEQMLESLRRFVSYRTISSNALYQAECRRGASYLRSVFKNFGAVAEMLPTSDSRNPVILARFRGNPATNSQRKKILFYGHYDVVAADDAAGKWINDPFSMEGIDGFCYGRGTSDNKGPIMAAIFACAELTSEQDLGSDIIFLIEGEEESGSYGFEQAVKAAKDRIGEVDWILLANSYWLDDRIPCLTYGLRGVIHATVQVESPHPDLHSGVDGSSQLDESLKDLVVLLATLTGKDGKVNIPGFYDPIPDLSKDEAYLYHDIVTSLIHRNPDLGDPEQLAADLMHRWRDPSLTIHRFETSGPENATIIPRLAKAALSLRLVPNQEASKVAATLIEHLEAGFQRLGSNNKLTVSIDHMAEPWLGDWKNEIFKCLESAIMEVWGPIDTRRRWSSSAGNQTARSLKLRLSSTQSTKDGYFGLTKPSPTTSTVLASGSTATPEQPLTPLEEQPNLEDSSATQDADHANHTSSHYRRKPLYIREGGSVPAIRFLEKEFDAPAAHLPCGQASDSAHLDNERLRLVNLYKSKEIFKRVFKELPCK